MFSTEKFGAYLAHLRKQADMTQSELGERLNITRQAVSKYETGDSFPDISILSAIAATFGVSLATLIASGEPTDGESKVLGHLARGEEAPPSSMDDVMNIASLLKPSILEKLTSKLAGHGVDIEKIVALSQYMNDSGTAELIKNASFESLDGEAERDFMRHIVPLLDEKSKTALFGKIIEGELDWRNLEFMMPYMTYLYSQIEAAYLEGALPEEVYYWYRLCTGYPLEKTLKPRG